MKKSVLVTAVLFCAAFVFITCSQQEDAAETASASLSWIVPVEVADTPNSTEADYYDLGWKSFIGVNWPASGSYRGMPDTTLRIGAMGKDGDLLTTVWESWKEQYEIFLPDAANPGPWNTGHAAAANSLKQLAMFSKLDSGRVGDAFDEATGQPLITQDSQYVRYEVRTNESEYTYYLDNHYYNADSQMIAVSQNRFVGFPKGNDPLSKGLQNWAQYGATEVKAAWRVFPPNTPAATKERYFHKHAILVNNLGKQADTVEIGLIGFHILRLTPFTHNTWYWASFEQVDNVALQPQYGGTVPSHPTFSPDTTTKYPNGYFYTGGASTPPPVVIGQPLPKAYPVNISSPPFTYSNPVLDSVNMVYNKLLQGTVFQYYQLIGTVNPPAKFGPSHTNTSKVYSPVTVNTAQMANATMETYVVKTNCISCHIGGYPQVPDSIKTKVYSSSNEQVFTFLPGLAQRSKRKK
jgi:hypothetical protein